jgi:hypothetical protein
MNNSTKVIQGFSVASQMPLDSKANPKSENTLKNLGINDYLVYTYHDGFLANCLQEKSTWVWREALVGEVGLLDAPFEYPAGHIVNEINYSLKKYNFFKINKLDKGGFTGTASDLKNLIVFSSDIVVSLSNGKTAGKYTNGQTIPLVGKTPQQAFNDIFREPLFPTLVSPSLNALSFNKGSIQEAGATLTDLILTAVFNRGSITPQHSAVNAFRSGLPIQHLFTRPGGNTVTQSSSLNLSNTIASYVVALGANNFTAQVNYDAGVQPKDNMGNDFDVPLVAGSSNILTATFQGIYPIFYSVSNTPPVANQALINTSTKSVLPSDGTLNIEFGASGQYIWFAHPASMPTKTKWFVNSLNNGNIGTISDLFNAPTTVNITTALWNGIPYKIYISNNPTTTIGNMELKNS